MLVKNENFQEQNLNDILNEILGEFNADSNVNVSENEAKQALALMAYEGTLVNNQYNLKNKNYTMPNAQAQYLSANVIDWIWNKLQEKVCPLFDEKTEQEKIAEIIAEAIANFISFGVIVKRLLKIVLFFVLKYGHSFVCKMQNNNDEV